MPTAVYTLFREAFLCRDNVGVLRDSEALSWDILTSQVLGERGSKLRDHKKKPRGDDSMLVNYKFMDKLVQTAGLSFTQITESNKPAFLLVYLCQDVALGSSS